MHFCNFSGIPSSSGRPAAHSSPCTVWHHSRSYIITSAEGNLAPHKENCSPFIHIVPLSWKITTLLLWHTLSKNKGWLKSWQQNTDLCCIIVSAVSAVSVHMEQNFDVDVSESVSEELHPVGGGQRPPLTQRYSGEASVTTTKRSWSVVWTGLVCVWQTQSGPFNPALLTNWPTVPDTFNNLLSFKKQAHLIILFFHCLSFLEIRTPKSQILVLQLCKEKDTWPIFPLL